MLFGLLLAALIGMDANSYVAADCTGYMVYLAGEQLGWYDNLEAAERRYRMALLERRSLDALSCLRAEEIIVSFSHTRSNGQPWSSALPVELTGFAMEVLATGPDLPTVLRAWQASPSHAEQLNRPVIQFGFCQNGGYFAAHGAWPVILGAGDVALVTGQNLLLVVIVVLLIMIFLLMLRNIRAI
jgi:hypothetical protein